MSDHFHIDEDEDEDPSRMLTEAEMRAVLEESDADIAAGRIVPMEVLLEEARAAIRRIEAKRAERALVDIRQA